MTFVTFAKNIWKMYFWCGKFGKISNKYTEMVKLVINAQVAKVAKLAMYTELAKLAINAQIL